MAATNQHHKLEITNAEPHGRGLWKLADLPRDNDFQKTANKEPSKRAWMDHLEIIANQRGAVRAHRQISSGAIWGFYG